MFGLLLGTLQRFQRDAKDKVDKVSVLTGKGGYVGWALQSVQLIPQFKAGSL